MRARFAIAISVLLLPSLTSAATPACTATSGKLVPAVVELYTSEGCDSCPPADRWFSALKDQAARGKVVPLAFHTDYWDYLGWKDRFADPAYDTRHRQAANRGGAKVVYTPQVVYEGREFQQWRRTNSEKLAASSPAKAARAELRVSATPAGAQQLQVEVSGRTLSGARPAEAYVALYENGLSSDVQAGENKGVMLHHDFVVRRWLGPFAFDAGTLAMTQKIGIPSDGIVANAGVAVIAYDEQGAVMQALALPLRECGG